MSRNLVHSSFRDVLFYFLSQIPKSRTNCADLDQMLHFGMSDLRMLHFGMSDLSHFTQCLLWTRETVSTKE